MAVWAIALSCARPRHEPGVAAHRTAALPGSNEDLGTTPADPETRAGAPMGSDEPSLPESEPEPPAVVYPFHDPLPEPALPRTASAMQNANLSPAQCKAELRKRGLPVSSARGAAKGIAAPVRLTGPLHGVRFVSPGTKSPYGMLDCRLALTMDDLAAVLAMYGVAEVRIDNFYRPRAHLPGSRKPSQHSYGLAADITQLRLADGATLVVERDFQGTRGQAVCGPGSALVAATPEAIALRNLLCAIAVQGLFHHMLTPNYDEAHRDHLHLDIKRDEKRRSLH